MYASADWFIILYEGRPAEPKETRGPDPGVIKASYYYSK